jgi:hypothetical protein
MQPDEIIPLDPDEFFAAHEYASMVADNEFLEEIPVLESRLKFEDQMIRFANVPENRFGFAVMKFFGQRKHDKGWSFMMRFFAMMGLMNKIGQGEEMQPYVRKNSDGRLEFHRAVFEVAATQKLNSRFEFPPGTFLRLVKQAAKRMEAEKSKKI